MSKKAFSDSDVKNLEAGIQLYMDELCEHDNSDCILFGSCTDKQEDKYRVKFGIVGDTQSVMVLLLEAFNSNKEFLEVVEASLLMYHTLNKVKDGKRTKK